MQQPDLLLAMPIEPEHHQIRMSVAGVDPDEPGVWPDWADNDSAVSGSGVVFVATRSDDSDPVAISVYRGRPPLEGWTHIHTALRLVGAEGLAVGMTVSAVEHAVPTAPGPTTVEVWVRPADSPSEVTFVLEP